MEIDYKTYKLPYNFQGWNRSMRGIYLKGRLAYLQGDKLSDCPYNDYRQDNGHLTWSRAFINCWIDGFRDMELIINHYNEREG